MLNATTERTVVLIGTLGHGKTHVFNRLCGSSHASSMSAGSCTRDLVSGRTVHYNVRVIDTPGFASTDCTGTDIRTQREAIEGCALSGIYAVVKFGAPSDMAASLGRLMDFSSNEAIRVIVTHLDVALDQEPDFDVLALQLDLARLIDVPLYHILVTGRKTPGLDIEVFLRMTLHTPMVFKIQYEQAAYAAALTAGARCFNNKIAAAAMRLTLMSFVCRTLYRFFGRQADFHSILSPVAKATVDSVNAIILEIRQESAGLSPETQFQLQERLEVSVVQKLNNFSRCVSSYLTHVPTLGRDGNGATVHPIRQTSPGSTKQLNSHHLEHAVAAPPSKPNSGSKISSWDCPSVPVASKGSKLDGVDLGRTRPARDNSPVHHTDPDRRGSTQSYREQALQWQSPGLVPPNRPLETRRSATIERPLIEKRSTRDTHPSCRRKPLSGGFNETYSTKSHAPSARADADLGRTSRQDFSHRPSGNADTRITSPVAALQEH